MSAPVAHVYGVFLAAWRRHVFRPCRDVARYWPKQVLDRPTQAMAPTFGSSSARARIGACHLCRKAAPTATRKRCDYLAVDHSASGRRLSPGKHASTIHTCGGRAASARISPAREERGPMTGTSYICSRRGRLSRSR